MIKGVYSEHLPISKFLIFVGLLLTGFGLSSILSLLGVQFIFGLDVLADRSILSDFSNPAALPALKFVQFFNHLGTFFFPALMFAYMVRGNIVHALVLDKKPKAILALLTILVMFVSLPIINYLVEINAQMNLPDFLYKVENWMKEKEDTAAILTRSFLEMPDFNTFLVNLLIIGVIPAIGEELFFRGLIQTKLSQLFRNYHAGIWVSAILFSAFHLQFYGFIPRMLLGALFGYLFVWSGSLWIPILAHFVNNGGAVIVQYAVGEEYMQENVDTIGTQEGDLSFILVSSLILIGLLFVFYRKRAIPEKHIESA